MGVACAAIATGEGRDKFGWFICGAVLGPFVILLLADAGDSTKKVISVSRSLAGDSGSEG